MNKREIMFLRIVALITLLILCKMTTTDITNIQKYIIDICMIGLSILWTIVEIFNYEGWKP